VSDHNSAEIFGMMFRLVDKEILCVESRTKFATALWNASRKYDFSDCQLECDDALKRLNLAEVGFDPDHPDEEMMLYGPPEDRR